MRQRWAFSTLLMAAGLAAAPAIRAQEPVDDRIVVEGRRAIEVAREYVETLADPVSHNFGIARWEDSVCVGVENIETDAAQYVVDRISEMALQLGLDPGEPGCQAQIVIIFATDGQALATLLVEEYERDVFRPFGGAGGTGQGINEMLAFAESDAAVRWWQISMPVDRDGAIAITLPGRDPTAPVQVNGSNSRLVNLIHDQLWTTLAIVDVGKMQGATWEQLADYLAMVTLAQVDPDADTSGFDTILNLAADPAAAPPAMTSWDEIYLTSLYSFDQERAPRIQGSGLAREMVRQREDTAGE